MSEPAGPTDPKDPTDRRRTAFGGYGANLQLFVGVILLGVGAYLTFAETGYEFGPFPARWLGIACLVLGVFDVSDAWRRRPRG